MAAANSLIPICASYTGMEARQQRKIVEFLFGGSLPPKIITSNSGKVTEESYESAREIFEPPGSAPMQCRTVIEAAKKNASVSPSVKAQYEVCWLCSLSLTDKKITSVLGNSICEHVLPIIQAVMYIGLFYRPYYLSLKSEAEAAVGGGGAVGGAGAIGGAGGKEDVDMYKLVPQTKESYLRSLYNEYRYAHRVCNSLKSEKLFIHNNPKKGLFEMNEVLIEKLLSEIYNKAPAAFNKRYTEETFIKERKTAIGNVIFPIITRMNGEFEDAGKSVYAPNLSQLAAAAALITYPRLEEEGIAEKLIIGAGQPAIDPPQIACQIIKQVTDIYKNIFDIKSKSKGTNADKAYEDIITMMHSASTIKAPVLGILGELEACCTPGKECKSPLYEELLASINTLATIGISSPFELTSIKQSLISTLMNNVFKAALPAASVSGSRTRTIPLSKDRLIILNDIQLALQEEFVEDKALLLKLVASKNVCGTIGPVAGVTTKGARDMTNGTGDMTKGARDMTNGTGDMTNKNRYGTGDMTNGTGQYASKEEANLLWGFSQGVKQSLKKNKTRKGPKQQNIINGNLRRKERARRLTAKRKENIGAKKR